MSSQFLLQAIPYSNDLQNSIRKQMGGCSEQILHFLWKKMSLSPQTLWGCQKFPRNQHSFICRAFCMVFLSLHAWWTGLHLPYTNKAEVFLQLKEDYQAIYDDDLPSQAYFILAWKLGCNGIKVRKASRFAQSAKCFELGAALQVVVHQQMDTSSLKKRKKAHVAMIMRRSRSIVETKMELFFIMKIIAPLSLMVQINRHLDFHILLQGRRIWKAGHESEAH